MVRTTCRGRPAIQRGSKRARRETDDARVQRRKRHIEVGTSAASRRLHLQLYTIAPPQLLHGPNTVSHQWGLTARRPATRCRRAAPPAGGTAAPRRAGRPACPLPPPPPQGRACRRGCRCAPLWRRLRQAVLGRGGEERNAGLVSAGRQANWRGAHAAQPAHVFPRCTCSLLPPHLATAQPPSPLRCHVGWRSVRSARQGAAAPPSRRHRRAAAPGPAAAAPADARGSCRWGRWAAAGPTGWRTPATWCCASAAAAAPGAAPPAAAAAPRPPPPPPQPPLCRCCRRCWRSRRAPFCCGAGSGGGSRARRAPRAVAPPLPPPPQQPLLLVRRRQPRGSGRGTANPRPSATRPREAGEGGGDTQL